MYCKRCQKKVEDQECPICESTLYDCEIIEEETELKKKSPGQK